MADLTVATASPVKFTEPDLVCLPCNVDIARGQLVIPGSGGKWILAEADTVAAAGRPCVALHAADANMPLTAQREGLVDVGEALAALAFGAQVFLSSATAGAMADAAGTVSVPIGVVWPGWGSTTPDKLLKLEAQPAYA